MAFKLITPKNTRNVMSVKRSSLATTVGALYIQALSGGATALADASTTQTQVLYLANETLASGSTPFSATVVSAEDIFLVDTENNTASTHDGQRMAIGSTGLTLNNTGTDTTAATGVFEQVAIVGATSDKKILARKV